MAREYQFLELHRNGPGEDGATGVGFESEDPSNDVSAYRRTRGVVMAMT